ncbi:MAG: hypothetical protein N2376_02165, partial [Clostridia bacterium]|nr:hypothetical protein [Clostridia bacterium]
MKRALISVSDKSGIIALGRALQAMGMEIVATSGTLKHLREHEIKAVPVSEVTGYPEFLDGRIKTIHPDIHAGIMAERSNEEHMSQLQELHITPVDLVVINLYPFKDTLLKGNVALGEAIEKIDIGGPALIRSAALN